MLEVLGIVIFALLIALSIGLHEVGHLLPAKLFGIKVTEYMIGFGPTIWSKVKGETRYGVKAVPLGGYIRMVGMLPPARDGSTKSMSTGRFATMVADARRQSLEEVVPGEEDRAFYRHPVHQRIIVMLGGPAMNLLLAFLLFAAVLVGIGIPEPTTQVDSVAPCTTIVRTDSTGASVLVGEPLPSGECPTGTTASPASVAGLQPGDVIVAIDGTAITDWDQMSTWIRSHPGATAVLTVQRDGADLEVPMTIAEAQRPVVDDQGMPTGEYTAAGYAGIAPYMEWVGQPWSTVPTYMWDLTTRSVQALVMLPVRLYELVTQTLIGGQERSPDSPVSVVGVTRLGGDIAAAEQPMEAKVATFLSLAASLNLFLFLFNLLPILPLDGGHVVGALWEAIRRGFAKVRGKPDPGPVDMARLLPVAYVVAGCLIAMSVVVIWADLVRPIAIG
jgi:membrane-associated protease RseP (regulator of RpoE activity)